MSKTTKDKQIYIVVSQTGSLPSRVLRWITGDEYNHVSISLEEDLDTMYSFARRYAYYPFWGGLVRESRRYGAMRRFKKTQAVVMAISVDGELYSKMREYLEQMYLNRKQYHYNYLGVMLAGIHVHYHPTNHYYCSSFVKEMLVYFDLIKVDEMKRIVHPIDFLERFGEQEIFCGRLHDYQV